MQLSPWTVLAQGITSVTGWSIGFSTFIISLFVLFCWIPLRQTLGMGTILNAIIIALVLEFFLPYIPVYDSPALKISEAVTGWCQTNANQSLVGQGACLLSRAEAAPLGKSSGTVELENGARVKVALQIEMVVN